MKTTENFHNGEIILWEFTMKSGWVSVSMFTKTKFSSLFQGISFIPEQYSEVKTTDPFSCQRSYGPFLRQCDMKHKILNKWVSIH